MPVGSADKGVGLGAGEIMLTTDFVYNHIDWEHSPIGNEPFYHSGILNSKILNLGLTIGLNDYWNVTINQLIIERCMEWHPKETSSHHRTECSSSDFENANGGYLGDTSVKFKYLLENQGKGPGNRFFIGGGLIIPSNYALTYNPFLSDNGEYQDHRHFALSEGAHKIVFDFQFFQKRKTNPVFWGVTFGLIHPLESSDYGFYPSKVYDFSLTALSGPTKIKTNFFMISSIGLSYAYRYTTNAKWDDAIAPNSKSNTHIPGISIIIGSKNLVKGSIGLNFSRAYLDNLNTNDDVVEQDAKVWQFSLSYRIILDKYIDRLYWN